MTMMKVCMPERRSTHTMRRGVPRHPGVHRGLTLTELVVAIALFTLVLGLLGFPLISAFGYIQKAIAQSDAKTAGLKVTRQLRQEIEGAGHVFAIPPSGEWISFIPADENGSSTFGNYESASAVSFVRYSRVLDYPWTWDKAADEWRLLQPNRSEAAFEDQYERRHYPFYSKNVDSQRSNPYILARYQEEDLTFRSATVTALDGSYPMDQDDYWNLLDSERNQGLLLRKFRDDMVAVTPHGPDWDVSQFTVRPMRVATEALQRGDSDSSAVCTSVFSRYPLWAGRSRDLDEYEASLLEKFYYPLVDTMAVDQLTDLRDFINNSYSNLTLRKNPEYQLYPLYPDTADGPVKAAKNWRNPFGYQIRVFDRNGQLAFGFVYDNNLKKYTDSVCNRHYMEWPPIGRNDLSSNDFVSMVDFYNLNDPDVQEWKTAVMRQRAAGQVVFDQPMRVSSLQVASVGSIFTAKLPTPDDTKWIDGITYLVSPSAVIKVTDESGNNETFRLVKSAKDFTAGTFYFPNLGGENWYSGSTREVQFKAKGILNAGNWTVVNPTDNKPYRYTICDLQPTDTVVATYSTQGMLDLGLTLSRKDRSGAKQQNARQNYTVNLRVEARNAMRRARRSE
ncbi:MAG: PilW family protein [Armatimonadota bacterium]